MSETPLFELYAPTPRQVELGGSVMRSARKGWLAVLYTLAGSFALGVPMSFLRARRSRPWEPLDMLVMGIIIAAFTVPIAGVAMMLFRRYVKLFRTGRLVEGRVVEQRGSGVVIQVAIESGPDRTFVPALHAPIGQQFPVIVGATMSSLALTVVGRGDLRRGSLVSAHQVAQVSGAG